MNVSVLSPTKQEFDGQIYYSCGFYFQKRGKRLHRAVWEYHNGPIPKGYHVHHIDENRANNDISNLMLIESFEHLSKHSLEHADETRARFKYVQDCAKEWHGSPEGLAFHSKLAKYAWGLREPNTYKCTQCGVEYKTKNIYSAESNTFCSNDCKAQFRRESGIDNETRVCKKCGKEFLTNKYGRVRYCSRSCGHKAK